MPEWSERIVGGMQQVFDVHLFSIGEAPFTLASIIYLILLLAGLIYFSGLIKRVLVNKVFVRRGMDIGVGIALGSIVRYIILFFGLLIILQTAGIDLTSVTVLAGALGIGVGFGLQNIASDFVSGIIIMVARPIKVGDRVEVAGIVGDVQSISARASSIVTNDNISIIVPNSEFIRSHVTNWSHMDRRIRLHLPVGVSYNSEPEHVREILLRVARACDGVLQTPEPDVIFLGFGESSLDFELRIWTNEFITRPYILKSNLYFDTWKAFKEEKIEIPFPQRDLHLKSGSLSGSPSPQ